MGKSRKGSDREYREKDKRHALIRRAVRGLRRLRGGWEAHPRHQDTAGLKASRLSTMVEKAHPDVFKCAVDHEEGTVDRNRSGGHGRLRKRRWLCFDAYDVEPSCFGRMIIGGRRTKELRERLAHQKRARCEGRGGPADNTEDQGQRGMKEDRERGDYMRQGKVHRPPGRRYSTSRPMAARQKDRADRRS